MADSIKCLFFSISLTLFANTPQMFEWPIEKIGFGAILFFIIWMYLKHILPKTHEEMDRKNERIQQLMNEVQRLNDLRVKDQKIIAALLREVKQSPSKGGHLNPETIGERIDLEEIQEEEEP